MLELRNLGLATGENKIMKFEWCVRGAAVCVAALVVVNCFGKAIHSEDDPAAAAGGSGGSVDGSTNTVFGGNGFTAESVVSSQSAQVTSSSSTSSGGAGGTTGSGGSNGITGVGGIPGIGGSTSGVTGGDVQLPGTCVTTDTEWLSDAVYAVDVTCSGAPMRALCTTEWDGADCFCDSDFLAGGFDFLGLTVEEAIPYTIAACLQANPFEAEPYECIRGYDVHNADACFLETECARDAVMGEVTLTEAGVHTTRCSKGTKGWTCTCSSPVYGVAFLVPTLNSTTACVEARDWCQGQELELSGKRDCTRTELSVTPDSCSAWMECTQAVVASGMQATMFETKPLECRGAGDGRYECSCLSQVSQGSFYVDAPDSAGACDAAVDICAGG